MTKPMTTGKEFEHVEAADGDYVPGTIVETSNKACQNGVRVLVPHPSRDPDDPLNWSSWEKYSTYLTVCFFTVLATINSSNFTVAIGPISKEFHESSTRTGYLVCFNVLFLGLGNLVWVAAMRVVGKRPVYLVALLLFVACNVWSYEAKTYGSLLAARIVSGFAASAADATVPSLVADLFFIHERGHCMMIFHLALSCGFFLGPLICAYITQGPGWRWSCGFLAIAGGATFLAGVFTIHETNYERGPVETETLEETLIPRKKSFMARLSLTSGYNKNASFWKTTFRILSLAAYPPITWVGLTVGTFVGWNIVVQLTSSRTFTKPPYGWKIGSLGLLSISGFIGALLAFFLGGKLIDFVSTRLTRRNNGKREPEFRLPAIVIPAVIGPMGILIFGLCVVHKTSWIGAAFGYGMQGFGLTAVANVAVTFAVDAYQPLAGEALVVVFVIRNTIATMLALFTVNWQSAAGEQKAFGQMVAIQYLFLLMALPMFFYGKQIRSWTSKFGPMKALVVET